MLAIAGAATAFINGGTPDHTTPNNSLIVEVSPGAEISTIGYPYSGGALAAGSDHTGGNQDAIGVAADDCAGAKIAVAWNPGSGTCPGGGNGGRQWGSTTCDLGATWGNPDQTGATGNFTTSSQTQTTNTLTPGGSYESVIVTTLTEAAETRPMQVIQKTIVRDNNQWFATVYYLTNTHATCNYDDAALGGVRLFQGVDFNFNGDTTQTSEDATYDAANDVIYGQDTTGGQTDFAGFSAGLSATPAPNQGLTSDDFSTYGSTDDGANDTNNGRQSVWGGIRDNVLINDAGGGETQYAAGAMRWNLGNMNAGAAASLAVIWARGDTQAAMQANITAGLAVRRDAGIASIDSPAGGSNFNPGDIVNVTATAALYGIVDQNAPVQITITGAGGSSCTTALPSGASMGTANLSIPTAYTAAASTPYNWDTSNCGPSSYTIQVCTAVTDDQTAGNDCQSIVVNINAQPPATINGVDPSTVPLAPNNSLYLAIPSPSAGATSGGGEISALFWPYGDGTLPAPAPSDSDESFGKDGDNGLGQDFDDCAGSKIAVQWDPQGAGLVRQWGSSTCDLGATWGNPDQTGTGGNLVQVSQVTTVNNLAPSGEYENVLVNTLRGDGTNLNLTQKVIIRDNGLWYATVYYVTNNSGITWDEGGGVRFFQGADFNFNGDGSQATETSNYTAGTQTIWGQDTNAPGGRIAFAGFTGVMGPNAAANNDDFSVYGSVDDGGNDTGTGNLDVWGGIRNDVLINDTGPEAGYAAGAQRWNLGTMAAGATVPVAVIWGVGQTQAAMDAAIATGMGKRIDTGITAISGVTAGDTLITGSSYVIGATAALYGVVDQNAPVQITITSVGAGGAACTTALPAGTSMGTATLAVPSPETATASTPFTWNTAGCGDDTYNIQVCTVTTNDQVAGNNCQTIAVTLQLLPFRFINGVDTSLLPPAANQSLLIGVANRSLIDNDAGAIVASGGAELAAMAWPYGDGTSPPPAPAATAHHMGKTGDNGFGANWDDCAGAKQAVRWDPGSGTCTGTVTARQWGSTAGSANPATGCTPNGADTTGPNGDFNDYSQTITTNNATPSGEIESVIITTLDTPSETSPLQVVQKTIIRQNSLWFATVYYVTNTSTTCNYDDAALGGVRFFEGVDFNFNGAVTNDECHYDNPNTALNTIHQTKPAGTPLSFGGFSACSDRLDDDFGCFGPNTGQGGNTAGWEDVWEAMRDNNLTNDTDEAGDTAGALRWNLGNLNAGQTAPLAVIWGIGGTAANMNTNITAGCGVRWDAGISAITSPPNGNNEILGDVIPIDSTAALYGIVDANVPIIANVTGPSCSFTNIAVGSVDLSVPLTETAASPTFNWDTSTQACGVGAYTVQICTALGNLAGTSPALGDQNTANDCQSITVNLVDLVVQLDPDQSLVIAPGSNADYPITVQNEAPAQCVDFDVGPSTLGWASHLLDAAGTFLIASDNDGDGTWDFIAPGYDSCGALAGNNQPDFLTVAPPPNPTTANYTFRKSVPGIAQLGISDTTVLTVDPEVSSSDTATFITSTSPPATASRSLHLHPALGGADTAPDTNPDNTSTALAAFNPVTFQQGTPLQTDFHILSPVSVPLFIGTNGAAATIQVAFYATNGVSTINIGPTVSQNVNTANNPATPTTFTIPLASDVTIPAGYRLTVIITNNSANPNVRVWHDLTYENAPCSPYPLPPATPIPCGSSRIDMLTDTYIHLSVADAFDAAYPAGVTPATFAPTGVATGAYLRVQVQDPFGEASISSVPWISVQDPQLDYLVYDPPAALNCDATDDTGCPPINMVPMNTLPGLLMEGNGGSDPAGNTWEWPLPLQGNSNGITAGTYTVTIGNVYQDNGVSMDLPTQQFTFILSAASAVKLTSFYAQGYEDTVHVFWTTEQEINTLGYNIYRSTLPDRGFVQINWEIIAGLGNDDVGGTYLFADDTVEGDQTYFYILEEVERTGERTPYGPVWAYTEPGTTAPAVSSDLLTNAVFLDELPPSWTEGLPSGSPSEFLINRKENEDGTVEILIDVTVPPAAWSTVDVGGTVYDTVTIPTYGRLSSAGAPDVPYRALLVDVPQDMDFAWTLTSTGTPAQVTDARIVPAAPPALPTSDLNEAQDLPTGSTLPAEDPAIYGSNEAYPGEWASIEEGPSLPGGDSLLVSVYPVQTNPADELAEVASEMHLAVTLTPGDGLPDAGTPPASQFALAGAATVKILVTQTGIQRLTGMGLSSVGVGPGATSSGIQVFYEGREIPLAVFDGGDGILDATDTIEFYGEASKAEFSNTSVYWLNAGDVVGQRAAVLDANPALSTPVAAGTAHLSEIRKGDDTQYFFTLNAPGEDHWFHSFAFASPGGQNSTDLTLTPTGLVQSAGDFAILGYEIRGATRYAQVYPDHHYKVLVNGNLADEGTFDAYGKVNRRVAVPVEWLVPGTNTVRFTAIADSGVAGVYDSFYVNYAELYYPREFKAASSELRFSPPAAGTYTVAGFGSSGIRLYDVADPRELSILSNTEATDAGDGTWNVSLGLPAASSPGDRTILAVTDASVKTPALQANVPSSLSDTSNGADYLVISHSSFLASLAPLIELRESQGLRVAVTGIEDVYDEFSFGETSPEAIREFLRYARDHWVAPAPRYVLLVGDATYDPLGHLVGPAPGQLKVPTLLYDNDYLRTSSDSGLALLDGDFLPDVGVGRIPAQTSAEVDQVVAKILAYEATPMRADYTSNVLLVADNAKGTVKRDFDFLFRQLVSNTLAQIVQDAGLDPETILLPDAVGSSIPGGVAPITDAIVAALDEGVLLAAYSGHGAQIAWADETIFRTLNTLAPPGPSNPDHVALISNADKLAVLTVFDCLNAYFINPYSPSLGEVFLRDPDSGVAAFWGPTGLSPPNLQHTVAEAFYHSTLVDGVVRLGDATRAAFQAAAADPNFPDLVNTWVLLGDPALRLKINHPPKPLIEAGAIIPVGDALPLDGTGSADPNEDPVTYAWTVIQKPEGADPWLETAGAAASIEPDLPGTYKVRLTATDSFGASSAAEATFTATAPVPSGNGGTAPATGGCEMGGSSPSLAAALLLLLVWFAFLGKRARR
ncbi:MAG: C25 family cysteine peptidase [Bdellovibrionota bacterium]